MSSTYNPKVSLFSGRVQQIDYNTGGSAVSAGDVVVIGGIAYFAEQDIPANSLGALTFMGGTWAGNKASGAWTAGLPVFWNPTGTPNVGTASTGAFTQTAGSGVTFVGFAFASPGATIAALTGDQLGYFVKAIDGVGTSGAQTVAAAGSTNADAAALGYGTNLVTGANATVGVILPPAVAGRTVFLKNRDSDNAVLKVYPPALGQINALTATTGGLSMAAKTSAAFCSADGVNYFSVPLLPS